MRELDELDDLVTVAISVHAYITLITQSILLKHSQADQLGTFRTNSRRWDIRAKLISRNNNKRKRKRKHAQYVQINRPPPMKDIQSSKKAHFPTPSSETKSLPLSTLFIIPFMTCLQAHPLSVFCLAGMACMFSKEEKDGTLNR
jgi:hypothetical protein